MIVTTSAYTKEEQRSMIVTKSNELVRKARVSLSLQEQKVILYLISKIKPEDTEFHQYQFSLREICDVFGISYSGTNYNDLKSAILDLNKKSFWMRLPSGVDALMMWFSRVRIDKKSGLVAIQFGEDMRPYLLELKSHFTAYKLENALSLNSRYALQLYELLLSYSSIGEIEISLDDLKEYLGVSDKYPTFKNFRARVLAPSIEQINDKTNIRLKYDTRKQGRYIKTIIFYIIRID